MVYIIIVSNGSKCFTIIAIMLLLLLLLSYGTAIDTRYTRLARNNAMRNLPYRYHDSLLSYLVKPLITEFVSYASRLHYTLKGFKWSDWDAYYGKVKYLGARCKVY